MRRMAAVLAFIFLMMVGTTVWAEDQVLTIYFAGTSATEGWWDESVSCFGRKELVASLYYEQKKSLTNHKAFINGVGTWCGGEKCGSFNLSKIDAGYDDCRGWETCLSEAMTHLNNVLLNNSGDVILNLVGWSRGGVLTMRFAHLLKQLESTYAARIKGINILAVDPAGHRTLFGSSGVPEEEFCLGEKVKQYVGIYATDERTFMFGPAIPAFSAPTNFWMFRVPGSHETVVGNTQTDGHAADKNENCGGLECYDDVKFYKVSWVAKAVAKKLLGSSQWGNVEFDSESPWDAWFDEGQPGLDYESKKRTFIYQVETMWDYDYSDMRKNSILPDFFGFESWNSLLGISYCGLCGVGEASINDRCASLFTCPDEHRTVSLEKNDFVEKLVTGEDAWGTLELFGHCVNNLAARAKLTKVQLTWTHLAGTHHYNVYRSTMNAGPYTKIGSTTSTYSIYLDNGPLAVGTPYYYVVRPAQSNENETCQSNQASAAPTTR